MNNQTLPPINSVPLITKERTQKLEMLEHLITNLSRPIVLCGPNGVGKSYLLDHFRRNAAPEWLVCSVKGDNQLDIAKLQETMGNTITQNLPDYKFQSLKNAFESFEKRQIPFVLLIDNAGNLSPGLIETLINYCSSKPMLRLVLVLTHNELYLKNGTDPLVDDCYQIDLPPLSEDECREYLEYLSTLANPRISFNAISEKLVRNVYQETHGIPGNILEKFPEPQDSRFKDNAKTILVASVAVLIVLALVVQWWSAQQKETTGKIEQASTENKSGEVKQNASNIQTTQTSQPTVPPVGQAVAQNNTTVAAQPNDATTGTISQPEKMLTSGIQTTASTNPAVINPATVTANGVQALDPNAGTDTAENESAVSYEQVETNQWVSQQPPTNQTLQLAAMPKPEKILEVMQRNQALGLQLRLVKTVSRAGRDRFVLLFGSFATPEEAKTEAQKLPKELKQYWLRPIEAIQKELPGAVAATTPISPAPTSTP